MEKVLNMVELRLSDQCGCRQWGVLEMRTIKFKKITKFDIECRNRGGIIYFWHK